MEARELLMEICAPDTVFAKNRGYPEVIAIIATALAAKDAELAGAKRWYLDAIEQRDKYARLWERAEAGERAAHDAANTAIRHRDEARAQLAEANKALDQIAAIEPQSNCDAGSMARSRMRDIARLYIARRAREQGGE